jgi:hypothetical protein
MSGLFQGTTDEDTKANTLNTVHGDQIKPSERWNPHQRMLISPTEIDNYRLRRSPDHQSPFTVV